MNSFFSDRQQRLADIEAKKAQKEVAFNEKEAKKAIKEEAEVPGKIQNHNQFFTFFHTCGLVTCFIKRMITFQIIK